MAAVFQKVLEGYYYYNYELMDSRSAEVFLLRTPFPWMILVASYVYFVKVLGPRLMRDRPPFQLDALMKIYNIAQILVNSYLFIKAIQIYSHERSDWSCMPIVNDGSEYANLVYNSAILYFQLKIADFMDTIFFVLRKKNSQVTFLHVYHHAIMVFAIWMAAKYVPGGNVLIQPATNVFVHAVMYSYYLLTSINSEYKKSFWWKKHITQLQMVQFMVAIAVISQTLFWNPCGYPVIYALLMMSQNVFMLVLFYDFYRKAYGSKKKTT